MKSSYVCLVFLIMQGAIRGQPIKNNVALNLGAAVLTSSVYWYLFGAMPCHDHWTGIDNYCGDITTLMQASAEGDSAKVNHLLEEGAYVNERDNIDGTPLIYAVRRGHEYIVARLIEAGADVNIRERGLFAYTPLMTAAMRGDKALVMLLKNAGADLNARDYWGATSSMLAEKNGFLEVAALLQ